MIAQPLTILERSAIAYAESENAFEAGFLQPYVAPMCRAQLEALEATYRLAPKTLDVAMPVQPAMWWRYAIGMGLGVILTLLAGSIWLLA